MDTMSKQQKAVKQSQKSKAEVLEYNGHDFIKLTASTGYPQIGFGLQKAQLILENIKAIEKFVASQK